VNVVSLGGGGNNTLTDLDSRDRNNEAIGGDNNDKFVLDNAATSKPTAWMETTVSI
jgi:hypothetical protein